MNTEQMLIIAGLVAVGYVYWSQLPDAPRRDIPEDAPPREDAATGDAFATKAEAYQPAALSGSGEPPTSYVYK